MSTVPNEIMEGEFRTETTNSNGRQQIMVIFDHDDENDRLGEYLFLLIPAFIILMGVVLLVVGCIRSSRKIRRPDDETSQSEVTRVQDAEAGSADTSNSQHDKHAGQVLSISVQP